MRARIARTTPSPEAIADACGQWLLSRPDLRVIAAYAALPGEIDLSSLVSRHTGRTWLYPRVTNEHLTLHPIADPARQLVPGSFGILEPPASLPAVSVESVDAFLCPGLAFDGATGGRLGRGRGFYDRLLENARPDCVKAGICHPFQLVPDTFSEPHDIRMDLVITAPLPDETPESG